MPTLKPSVLKSSYKRPSISKPSSSKLNSIDINKSTKKTSNIITRTVSATATAAVNATQILQFRNGVPILKNIVKGKVSFIFKILFNFCN